ncbi:hypothetical protein [Lichenicoccus sp.]|uniref:hypothetical protein n=1 Tax=Lichenicoccus sp. TaxID=2781899 RepID=UPI003D099BC5
MKSFSNNSGLNNQDQGLYFMNGTSSSQRYLAIARRGNIFLGIRFSGLNDGAAFGAPGNTYLHARLRSARNQPLAKQLDLSTGTSNIIDLANEQLAMDEAWPSLPFDKMNDERASLVIGAFLRGSLLDDGAAVLARIEKGDLVPKLLDYAISHSTPGQCLVDAAAASSWLDHQAKSTLIRVKKKVLYRSKMKEAQHKIASTVRAQIEVVGPQTQLLNAIYQDHMHTYAPLAADT